MEDEATVEVKETKTRKAPAPVQVLIGIWDGDLAGTNNTFIVKARVANDPKLIKDTIRALGHGQYSIIVGREHTVNYAKTEVDVFQKG